MSVTSRHLELSILPEQFIVTRLAPSSPIPAWATQGSFFSITRASEELSIVCAAEQVPNASQTHLRWRAFKIHGPFAFSEIGVLASITGPLADAKISVFSISTFETDYVLVNSEQLPSAIDALRKAGHSIQEAKSAS